MPHSPRYGTNPILKKTFINKFPELDKRNKKELPNKKFLFAPKSDPLLDLGKYYNEIYKHKSNININTIGDLIKLEKHV